MHSRPIHHIYVLQLTSSCLVTQSSIYVQYECNSFYNIFTLVGAGTEKSPNSQTRSSTGEA